MPSKAIAEYIGRKIEVTVVPRLEGHFRIEQVGLWSHVGHRTGFTKLTVPDDVVFVTRAEAESYGLAFARQAIDRGAIE